MEWVLRILNFSEHVLCNQITVLIQMI